MRGSIDQRIDTLEFKPLISIVLPVYNIEERWLRCCIDSVLNQWYTNWELCIADDCSPNPIVRKVLEEYASRDKRFKIVFRSTNGHISAASNSALELATGEFTALLDHDDELAEDALFWVADELNRSRAIDLIYSDEDKIDESGHRFYPSFKPSWSRDLFYSLNLLTHLSVYRTRILRKIGGFRTGFEGSQDYDLALRFIEQIQDKNIRHIPRILYHWRTVSGSVAFHGNEKPYAHERARDAIRSHFERTDVKAAVSRSDFDLHRVRYELPKDLPKVCLFLVVDEWNRGVDAMKTISRNTGYQNCEVVIVANENTRPLGDFSLPEGVKRFSLGGRGRADRLNLAVSETKSEVLCFVDGNLTPLDADWLTELVSFAYQKEIGVAGGKVIYPDRTVADGGLVLGAGGVVGVAHQYFPRDLGGNMGRNIVIGNFSAVSLSCMAVRREAFDAVGCFDAENLPNTLFDADLCLRLRAQGLRIVHTPHAELMTSRKGTQPKVRSAPSFEESRTFAVRWAKYIMQDPFYNPNLSKKDASFSVDI